MKKLVVGVHDQNRASKQIHKTKKQAVKVVYISNPMKVNTSASQFRALVQQLTGRDADDMPAVPSFLEHSIHVHNTEEQVVDKEVHKDDGQAAAILCDVEDEDEFMSEVPGTGPPHLANGSDLVSLQDITGYFSPSNFWYESAFHLDASKV